MDDDPSSDDEMTAIFGIIIRSLKGIMQRADSPGHVAKNVSNRDSERLAALEHQRDRSAHSGFSLQNTCNAQVQNIIWRFVDKREMPFRVSVPRVTCWLFLCLIYYVISRRLFSNIDPGISDTYSNTHKNVTENISTIRTANVDDMSGRQMLEYLQWNPSSSSDCRYYDSNTEFLSSLPLCLDPRIRPEAGSCLAYFFRLNLKHRIMEKGEEFHLIRALARYGCDVYLFDPLLKEQQMLPEGDALIHLNPNSLGENKSGAESIKKTSIWVRPVGLSHKYEGHRHPLHPNWTLLPFSKIHAQQTDDVIIDYVFMDAEDWHPQTLSQIARSGMLKRIRQISLQVHIVPDGTTDELRDQVEILRALEEELGFVRFDSRGIPSSSDWLEPLKFEGPLSYQISLFNSHLLVGKNDRQRRYLSEADERFKELAKLRRWSL